MDYGGLLIGYKERKREKVPKREKERKGMAADPVDIAVLAWCPSHYRVFCNFADFSVLK